MKLFLYQIRNAQNELTQLGRMPLKARTGYKMLKLLRAVNEELQLLETQRQELVKKLGNEVTHNGQKDIAVTPENLETFNKEYSTLLSTEIELDFLPVLLSELEEDNVKFTVEQLALLEPFLQVE